MKWNTFIDTVRFLLDRDDDDHITIGGGEPTLHPKFFDIIKECMTRFDYTWLATNGSQTKTMYRLAAIMDDYDMESFECEHDDDERDTCHCYDDVINNPDGKLGVALSVDRMHDPIDQRIVDLWKRRSNAHEQTNFSLRDVTGGIKSVGRAATTGYGQRAGCACPSIFIKPSGLIKACGCPNAPTIGDVINGIEDKYQKMLESDVFLEDECWNAYRNKGCKA